MEKRGSISNVAVQNMTIECCKSISLAIVHHESLHSTSHLTVRVLLWSANSVGRMTWKQLEISLAHKILNMSPGKVSKSLICVAFHKAFRRSRSLGVGYNLLSGRIDLSQG
ncbi:hypothetical protein XU18_4216 [Perkinsela sp. CCAP 1560/4]|nr:hypothetical protein XU18_4216 [Perkinsela sp. CCAP 1560/4]|eukprot:KNH04565.1 hypothetical protein XU18_4216 [Perkinsela sp. CCAP 1560/4]